MAFCLRDDSAIFAQERKDVPAPIEYSNSKRLIALLHLVLKVASSLVPTPVRLRPVLQCPCCCAAMQIVRRRMCPATPEREPDLVLRRVAGAAIAVTAPAKTTRKQAALALAGVARSQTSR